MRTDATLDPSSVEVIEVIDDGIDPFGGRSPDTTIHDAGGARWIGPTAAAALVALIGYGIATSASTTGVPTAAQAPSTTAPATTPPVPLPTAPPRAVVPYYAADPSPEYRVQHADIDSAGLQRAGPGDYQLWAMPGSTAASGSWFSIESLRGPEPIHAVNAFRVATTDQSMAISHLASGQSQVRFSIHDLMSVTITAFGWGDEDLVHLAQSVTMNERSSGDTVRPSDPTLIDDFRLLTTVRPYESVVGEAMEHVFYSVGSDPTRGLSVEVVHLDPRKGDAGLADRRTGLRFLLDRPTPFEVDGHSAVAGAIVARPELSVATWIAGDHAVSVTGTVPVQEIITIARTVHPVSSDEWDAMKDEASRNQEFNRDYTRTEPHPVSFGTDAEGGQWTVDVSVSSSETGDETGVLWQWPPSGVFRLSMADTARITSFVDGDRTYVLAELPRAIAPSAQLQVTRTGLDPVLVPFNDTDPGVDRTFSAFAFSEPISFTAQIVGPDGAVLAAWPSA